MLAFLISFVLCFIVLATGYRVTFYVIPDDKREPYIPFLGGITGLVMVIVFVLINFM